MDKLRSRLDSNQLLVEATELPCHLDGSGALMASEPNTNIICSPYLSEAIKEIANYRGLNVVYTMLNKLPPRTTVPRHRDWLKGTRLQPNKPCLERWHLPIITNKSCGFWDEKNETTIMETGYWYGPVPYWLQHFVYNDGSTWRIHLVVDLDCYPPLGAYDD